MPATIVLSEPPAPVDDAAADRPFRLRYVGTNEGDEPTTGHWDHVAILDRAGRVQYEDWHREGPLPPGSTYEAVVDVGIALEGGSYLVWVTLDGGGARSVRRAEPLAVGGATGPGLAPGGRCIEVEEPPTPLERVRIGAPFRVFYTATNVGPSGSDGHYDRLVISGRQELWEGWHAVGPLDPGDHYDAVVDVPGLAAGDYRLEWTLDWAVNHPMAARNAERVHGQTAFTVT